MSIEDQRRIGIERAPGYVGNNAHAIFERIQLAFDEVKTLPSGEQMLKLPELQRMVAAIFPQPGFSIEDPLPHRVRIDVAFALASLAKGGPKHRKFASQLKGFTKSSFETLIKVSPKEALNFAKIPLSKPAQTSDLKSNLRFVDWGIIATLRLGRVEEIKSSPDLLAHNETAHGDLSKLKNRIIEERKAEKY